MNPDSNTQAKRDHDKAQKANATARLKIVAAKKKFHKTAK